MQQNNARQRVEDTCISLKQVQQYLEEAANNVENASTKTKIESQLTAIQHCINECENIFNTLG